MSEEEKKDIETLIKKLSYCELEYQQNGYLSVGKFNAIKQAIQVIDKQQKEIKKLQDEYLIQRDLINPDFMKDYISKDKIRERKEEFKKECNKCDYKHLNICEHCHYTDRIKLINEFLEEE